MPFLDNLIVTSRLMAEQNPEEINATFEELDLLESEFEDVELELSTLRPGQ